MYVYIYVYIFYILIVFHNITVSTVLWTNKFSLDEHKRHKLNITNLKFLNSSVALYSFINILYCLLLIHGQ